MRTCFRLWTNSLQMIALCSSMILHQLIVPIRQPSSWKRNGLMSWNGQVTHLTSISLNIFGRRWRLEYNRSTQELWRSWILSARMNCRLWNLKSRRFEEVMRKKGDATKYWHSPALALTVFTIRMLLWWICKYSLDLHSKYLNDYSQVLEQHLSTSWAKDDILRNS